MAYPKLAEGNRIWTASSGNNADSADYNELNDQLKGMLGPLETQVSLATGWFDRSNAGIWYYRKASGPWALQNFTAVNPIVLPLLTVRAGQVITEIDATVKGTTAGGSIILYRQSMASPAAPTSTATWASNPWATSNAWVVKSATAGLPHTVLADYEYYVEFTDSAVDPQYIGGLTFTAQFGN